MKRRGRQADGHRPPGPGYDRGAALPWMTGFRAWRRNKGEGKEMFTQYRHTAMLCLWSALMLLVWASAGTAQTVRGSEPGGKFGGTYRRTLINNPVTMDPAFVSDVYSRTVVRQVFDGLVQFDAHLKPLPAIAEFWEASRDGRTWTFTLRRGVKFHHGREVTAHDFVYSFTRLLEPTKAGPVSEFCRRLQGAEAFLEGKTTSVEGLKALTPYTLQLKLKEPFAATLTVLGLANAAVLPREEVERLGEGFARAPVGTGPFKLVRWESGKEIVLEAYDRYHEGRPFLDTIIFKIGAKFEEAFDAFLAGELEETVIPSQRTEEIRTEARYSIYQMLRKPSLGVLYLGFNTQVKPFDDKRVRQAFNYAVNKDAIVREITRMGNLTATGVLPPGMPGHDPDLRGYYYSPAKAKQLLAEAGYPEGAGFPVVQLWTVSKADSTRAELAAYQEYWAALGVQVEIQYANDWAAYDAMLRAGQAPIFRVAWYADIPDPDNFFTPLLHSAGHPNYMFYRNAEVDRLLDQARQSGDEAQRLPLYRQAERLVLEDAPWIPQHNHVFEHLYQPYVQGIEISLLGERWIPMNKIWLKKPSAEGLQGGAPYVRSSR
ncbi:MAG: ABC transporter substrate-binding protein [Candidatus Tectimicrobiota bacterium]